MIAKSLRSLLALTGPDAPGEIIVVDDGSADDTAETVAAFASVRLIRQPNQGKAAALNTGLAVATGEVVIVLDADTIVTAGFISMLARHFTDPSVGAVAANVKVGNRRLLLPKLQAVEYLAALNLDRRAQAVLNTIAVVPGAGGAFRRTALLAVGGYPKHTLVEDADLTVMLLRAGWKIPYEPDAVALTEAPERIRDVLRQRRRWAYGTVQVCARHADALLSMGAGRVGLVALPWMLLTQVVVPLTAPAADVYLLTMLASGNSGTVLRVLALAAALDIVITTAMVAAEHESISLLLAAPLLRAVWRPLQILAVTGATRKWARGETLSWRPSVRYDTVDPLVATRGKVAVDVA